MTAVKYLFKLQNEIPLAIKYIEPSVSVNDFILGVNGVRFFAGVTG